MCWVPASWLTTTTPSNHPLCLWSVHYIHSRQASKLVTNHHCRTGGRGEGGRGGSGICNKARRGEPARGNERSASRRCARGCSTYCCTSCDWLLKGLGLGEGGGWCGLRGLFRLVSPYSHTSKVVVYRAWLVSESKTFIVCSIVSWSLAGRPWLAGKASVFSDFLSMYLPWLLVWVSSSLFSSFSV